MKTNRITTACLTLQETLEGDDLHEQRNKMPQNLE